MNQDLQSPVITWPFWGQPFDKTPRGYFCRRNTAWALLKVAVGTVLIGVPVLFTVPHVYTLGLVVGFAAVAAGAHYLLFVRPIRPSVREARDNLQPWRAQWLDFEQGSLALQLRVRENGYRFEDAFNNAPYFPAYVHRLYNPLEIAMPEYGIPLDRQESSERAPHTMEYGLSALVCNLVRIGTPMVVGRIAPAGVLAILKPFDNYQVWVKVEFERSGDVLVPRLLTGFQTWNHRFQDNRGRRYPGDMFKVKWSHFKTNARFLFLPLPIVGFIAAGIAVVCAVAEYFQTDRIASFRSGLWPLSGDSSDPVILSGYKQAIWGSAQWTHATPEAQATLDSLKRQIIEAVTLSLARAV